MRGGEVSQLFRPLLSNSWCDSGIGRKSYGRDLVVQLSALYTPKVGGLAKRCGALRRRTIWYNVPVQGFSKPLKAC